VRRRRGFTLLEVVVALALASLVAVLVERLFVATGHAAHALRASADELAQEGNGRGLLDALLGSLGTGSADAEFLGGPTRLEFSAWCRQPDGWLRRERTAVFASGGALVAGIGEETLVLLRDVRGLQVDYLLSPGADEVWARSWVSPSSVPVAIRLRIERGARSDTLLVLVGVRG